MFVLLAFLLTVESRGFERSQFQSTFRPVQYDLEVNLGARDLAMRTTDLISAMETCVKRMAKTHASHTAHESVRLVLNNPDKFAFESKGVKSIEYFGTQVGTGRVGFQGSSFNGVFRLRRDYLPDLTGFVTNGSDLIFKRESCCRADSARLQELTFGPFAKKYTTSTDDELDFNFEEPHTAASVVASRTMVVDKFDGSLFRKPQGLADFERFFVGVTSTLRANADAIIHQSATEYDVKFTSKGFQVMQDQKNAMNLTIELHLRFSSLADAKKGARILPAVKAIAGDIGFEIDVVKAGSFADLALPVVEEFSAIIQDNCIGQLDSLSSSSSSSSESSFSVVKPPKN